MGCMGRQPTLMAQAISQSFDRVNNNSWAQDTSSECELLESTERQLSVMHGLKGVYCIFCLLMHGRRSKHITEQCYVAQEWSGIVTQDKFANTVRSWGRQWPMNRDASVYYCQHCRFPKTEDFHQDSAGSRSNINGCHFNDTLNRASWVFFTHRMFSDQIFKFSNNAIDVQNVEKIPFQQWLLQEPSAGRTNLFELFANIVETNGLC